MRKRSDSELENLLRELPKVTDDRHPSEIHQKMMLKAKKRKLPTWFVPSIAAGVVVVLLFILSPTMMEWQNGANEEKVIEPSNGEDSTMLDSEDENVSENTLLMEERAPVQNEKVRMEKDAMVSPSSVYSSDLEGFRAFTYPIPDRNVQVFVPVTVMVERDEEKTWFEQFEETMPKLTEEEWGLANYYPLNANLEYEETNQVILVDVPTDHQYGFGSAAETMFISILQNVFPEEIVKKLIFTTDGQKGITLGNYGELFELENKRLNQHAYYFLYSEEGNQPYLVPTEVTFPSINEALAEMKRDQDKLGLKASLPVELDFERLTEDEQTDTLHLYLSEGTKLNEEFIYSLEAIALTAKNFGYAAIRFENAGTDQIGPFNLAENIPVPIAPNKKY